MLQRIILAITSILPLAAVGCGDDNKNSDTTDGATHSSDAGSTSARRIGKASADQEAVQTGIETITL